jgi:hypothetical protein
MQKSTIPNWSLFSTHVVGLSIIPVDTVEDTSDSLYCAVLDLMLDSGDEIDETEPENRKHLSVITDTVSSDVYELIKICVPNLSMLFGNISNMVMVMDTDGNIAEEIDLNEFFDELSEFQETDDQPEFVADSKPVLH